MKEKNVIHIKWYLFKENLENYYMILVFQEPKKANPETIKNWYIRLHYNKSPLVVIYSINKWTTTKKYKQGWLEKIIWKPTQITDKKLKWFDSTYG